MSDLLQVLTKQMGKS